MSLPIEKTYISTTNQPSVFLFYLCGTGMREEVIFVGPVGRKYEGCFVQTLTAFCGSLTTWRSKINFIIWVEKVQFNRWIRWRSMATRTCTCFMQIGHNEICIMQIDPRFQIIYAHHRILTRNALFHSPHHLLSLVFLFFIFFEKIKMLKEGIWWRDGEENVL